MRKRYHKKRRSCPGCKSHKTGGDHRHTDRELMLLREFEKQREELRRR